MTTEIPTAEPFDAFERRLAAALTLEAGAAPVPADGRALVDARIRHRRRARRATWLAAAAALVLVAGVVGVVARTTSTDSSPYVDTDPGTTVSPGLVRTPDAMTSDWNHPTLLAPDGSQWRISSYTPWVRYSIDAVVEDESGPRHVSIDVEPDGSRDVVAESWPNSTRTSVGDRTAVVTATAQQAVILWHPRPGTTARLADITAADEARAEREQRHRDAIDAWQAAGGIGEPPQPEFPSGVESPLAADAVTSERLVRLASRLVSVDRETWLRGVDAMNTVFVTGDGPTGGVAAVLLPNAEGSTPRVMLPSEDGVTGLAAGPAGSAIYQFDVAGFPAGTFELQVSMELTSPVGGWTPVETETWGGGIGGPGDAYTPIFTPATVRGAPGEFEHYPITTLERTEPDHVRTLRWVSEGHSWLLRFMGSASGDDAIAFANSLVVPDDAAWEKLVFPRGQPPVGDAGSAFERQWLRTTGQLAN